MGSDTAELAPGPAFNNAKHAGRPAAATLGVAFGGMSGARWPRRPRFGVQRHRSFIEAHERFVRARGPLIEREHVLRTREAGRAQLSEAPHLFPATP